MRRKSKSAPQVDNTAATTTLIYDHTTTGMTLHMGYVTLYRRYIILTLYQTWIMFDIVVYHF